MLTCASIQVAVTLGTAIMSEDWVNECWKRRNELCIFATDPELMVHKQMPFKGLTIALFGFTNEDEQHMKETATNNGMGTWESQRGREWERGRERIIQIQVHYCLCDYVGATSADWGQSGVTHLVVSDQVESASVPHASSHVQVVKQQWFWESIQIDACADEHLYQARVNNFALL